MNTLTLEDLILSKYKSIMAFAKKINIPYTTVKGILQRGIEATSIQTAIEIAKALDTDVELLIEKDIGTETAIQKFNDKKLLSNYNMLDTHGKQIVDVIIEIELDRMQQDSKCYISEEDILPLVARSDGEQHSVSFTKKAKKASLLDAPNIKKI